MKKNLSKVIVPTLAICLGAALAGSISGTVAWYQYSTRVNAAYIGTSVGLSENLQISLRDAASGKSYYGWKGSLTHNDMELYLSDKALGQKVQPITSGAMTEDAALNKIGGTGTDKNDRLGIPGVDHTVRARKRFPAVTGHPDRSSDAGMPDHSIPVALQDLLHGRVSFLYGEFRVRFLSREKKVSQKGGQEHRNVLPDHCNFHPFFLTPSTAFLPLISHSRDTAPSCASPRSRLSASVVRVIISRKASTAAASSSSPV